MNGSGNQAGSGSGSGTSRYESIAPIGTGGMATVFVGRTRGAAGFSRYVALKRAHAHVKTDERLAASMKLEARLASRLHHANVVSVLDVEEDDGDLVLVLDYVEGCTLRTLASKLDKLNERRPRELLRVILDVAAGLHAAHQATDEQGRLLGLVHRDVSPSNILVGVDGVARIADFGIAKAIIEGSDRTETGILKGKSSYMAPEYVMHQHASALSDLFSLSVVAWEALAGERLFKGANEIETLKRVMRAEIRSLAEVRRNLAPLDRILARALARLPSDRHASVEEMAIELEATARAHDLVATHAEVSILVERVAKNELDERRRLLSNNKGDKDDNEDIETVVASSPLLRAAKNPDGRGGGGARDDIATASVEAPMRGTASAKTEAYTPPSTSRPMRSEPPRRSEERISVPPHSVPRHSVSHQSSVARQSVPPHSVPPHSVPPHSAPPHSAPPHSAPPHSAPPHSAPPHSQPHFNVSSRSDPSISALPPPSVRGSRGVMATKKKRRRGRDLLALAGAFVLLGLALAAMAVQLGAAPSDDEPTSNALPASGTVAAPPSISAAASASSSTVSAPGEPSVATTASDRSTSSLDAGGAVSEALSAAPSTSTRSGHRRSPPPPTTMVVSPTLAPKKAPPNPYPQSSTTR